jgi:hypothetical protein
VEIDGCLVELCDRDGRSLICGHLYEDPETVADMLAELLAADIERQPQ